MRLATCVVAFGVASVLVLSVEDVLAQQSTSDSTTVRGRVERLGADGLLAAVGDTVILSDGRWYDTTLTDRNGEYRFSRVPLGEYTITVNGGGQSLRCSSAVRDTPSAHIPTIRHVSSTSRVDGCPMSASVGDTVILARTGDIVILARGDSNLTADIIDTITVVMIDTVHVRRTTDTVYINTVYLLEGHAPSAIDTSSWHVSVGAGIATSFVGGMSFAVPAVTIAGEKTNTGVGGDKDVTVALLGGWWPRDPVGGDPISPSDPRPQYRDRAQAIASLSVSIYPDSKRKWWGLSFGAIGAWRTVRESDFYLERAYGLTGGARLRTPRFAGRFLLVGGLDGQFANVSEFGRAGSAWKVGLVPSVTVSYVFP